MNAWNSVRRARLLGLVVLGAAFVAGGISGVALDRALGPTDAVAGERDRDDAGDEDDDRDGRRGDRRVDLLDRLDLSADQQQQIDAIRSRWHKRVESYWDSTAGPRLRSIADSARADIRAVLTPAQIERYDSLRAEHRRARRDKRNDHDDDERGNGR